MTDAAGDGLATEPRKEAHASPERLIEVLEIFRQRTASSELSELLERVKRRLVDEGAGGIQLSKNGSNGRA